MALHQVIVPWKEGYDIGVGADLASGGPRGYAVLGEATGVAVAGGAIGTMTIDRIQETESLERALKIDAEANYGSGAFGAGANARFDYARSCKVQSSSLFMAVTCSVELEFLSIRDPVLADHAANDLQRPDLFADRYGNVFIRGIGRGGLFVGVMQIFTESVSESTDIAAKLGGSYALFSAEAQTKFREIQEQYRNECHVSLYHEGGPVDLGITDPNNPMQILDNANRFLKSFADAPAAHARPYRATLAPMSVARSERLPPNTIDIEHAQDVIIYCAKRRSALIDQINLLDYIRDNPGKFDYSNGADAVALVQAAKNFQTDLDLIADCASHAINRPADAVMPPAFAEARGQVFPSGVLPAVLPAAVSTGPEITVVPDFRNCTTAKQCRELAAEHNLKVVYEYQGERFEDFRVIDIRPPVGSTQAVNSQVTIVRPPSIDQARIRMLTDPNFSSVVGIGG